MRRETLRNRGSTMFDFRVYHIASKVSSLSSLLDILTKMSNKT